MFNLTIQKKEVYYALAKEYFNNISTCEYENFKFDDIVPKSISILIDHDFISTPSIKIKINLFQDQKQVGAYYLYVNKDKEFIDEFLLIK